MNGIKNQLPRVPADNYISLSFDGNKFDGFKDYDDVIATGDDTNPEVQVDPKDTWIQIYTSGTTGKH